MRAGYDEDSFSTKYMTTIGVDYRRCACVSESLGDKKSGPKVQENVRTLLLLRLLLSDGQLGGQLDWCARRCAIAFSLSLSLSAGDKFVEIDGRSVKLQIWDTALFFPRPASRRLFLRRILRPVFRSRTVVRDAPRERSRASPSAGARRSPDLGAPQQQKLQERERGALRFTEPLFALQAGQERFRSLTANFFGKADGFVVCSDVSRQERFRILVGF